jgi:hypothetical protein
MLSKGLSVVVPVYNGESFVADCVDSVLAQSDVAAEVVVVDDGSTDSTPTLLARYDDRITVVRQPNRGLSAARNAGIAHATGGLLLFLDADDLQPPGYLAAFAAAAQEAPAAEVFHCGWRAVDADGRPLYAQPTPLALDDDPLHELTVLGSPHIGALCVRRAAAERVGGFDTGLDLQEDWDYWLRLAAGGAVFRGVPGVQLVVRRHAASMARGAGGRLALVGLEVLERQLARHPRCPRCPRAEEGLARWRRLAVRSLARDTTRRFGLRPRGLPRWLATLGVALRRPRLAGAAGAELAAGRRPQ